MNPKFEINQINLNNINSTIDLITKDYSKVLPIRLDLYINKSFNSHEQLNEYLQQLRNNMRKNSMFNNLIWWVAKLEYGVQRRWHYHVLMLFDGQKHRQGFALAKALGDYWIFVITKGNGNYYSPNMHPRNYHSYALDMLEYHDTIAIANFKKAVVTYLAKESLILPDIEGMKDKAGKNYRSLRMSEYTPKNTNVGRPRIYEDHNNFKDDGAAV